MAKPRTLVAIEAKAEIRHAVDQWQERFFEGATVLDGFGGDVAWHESVGVWGYFYKGFTEKRKVGNYWNAFGYVPHKFHSNMIVEINPPGVGMKAGVQGVIAMDSDGNRWVLHGGRLNPSSVRISQEMFDAATSRERIPVKFSNGSVRNYYKVANIDASSKVVREQTSSFVAECSRVRIRYVGGQVAADEERKVATAEDESFPEVQGSYKVGAQSARISERIHADVWHALATELDRRGIKHSNARVASYGPDLRTLEGKRILFEIKSERTAAELQRGFGQLLLYEQLLGSSHRKILVLPTPPKRMTELSVVIERLGVGELHYTRKGRSIQFDPDGLSKLLA